MADDRMTLVHGMRRSGNHAIVNWLLAHDRFVFFNNVMRGAGVLTGRRTIPKQMSFQRWALRRIDRETLDSHGVIASLEDHLPGVRPFVDATCVVSNILIMRSPHNMLSSRIRRASQRQRKGLPVKMVYPPGPGPGMDRVIELWKVHAREFLGVTNDLENKVCVYFDAWFSDQMYRRKISESLGLTFTDRNFASMPRHGSGSSFDQRRVKHNSGLDVLNRADHLTESERATLDEITDDEELRELADRVHALHLGLDAKSERF